MAPTSRNSSRKQQKNNLNKKKRKEVSFMKREKPKRNPESVAKPEENYENLILYYLTKLKGLFANPNRPPKGNRENSSEKMRRELQKDERGARSEMEINPNKYVSRESTPKPRFSVQDNDIRDKIYDVVSAAIEYGYKNNIIERKGNYFVLRNKKNPKLANRQPTPGPESGRSSLYLGCNCSRCKAMNSEAAFLQNSRPVSSKSVYYDSRPPMDFPRYPRESILTSPVVPKSKSCMFNLPGTSSPPRERSKRNCSCKKCLLTNKKRKMP